MLNSTRTSLAPARLRKLALATLATLCAFTGTMLIASTPALAIDTHFFSTSFGAAGSTPANPYPLSDPTGIAVATNGDVYVTDPTNAWVEKFDSSGHLLLIFGKEVNKTTKGNICTVVSNDNCQPGVHSSAPGGFETPSFIAVDNSTDLSQGDVYVGDTGDELISKFTAEGELIEGWGTHGQLSDSNFPDIEGFPLAVKMAGIAVDPSGDLWLATAERVTSSNGEADIDTTDGVELDENGVLIEDWLYRQPTFYSGIAVDGSGNLYLARAHTGSSSEFVPDPESPVEVIHSPGPGSLSGPEDLHGWFGAKTPPISAIAIDSSTEDLYVEYGSSIGHFNHPCTATECSASEVADSFGASYLSGAKGLAVNPGTHGVYAADTGAGKIDVFISAVLPTVTTGSAAEGANTTAIVSGTVNPENIPLTECAFQYGETESYGETAPCEAPSASSIHGDAPVTVHAELKNIKPNSTTYHFRLIAANKNGVEEGHDQTFVTATQPSITEEAFIGVTLHSATLSAQLDTHQLATTYHFEYGTSEAYGSSTPTTSLPGGPKLVTAEATLGLVLQPETTYHFRIVATNANGTSYGPDATFTTQINQIGLPDGRGFEMVSPVDNANGNVYEPVPISAGGYGIPENTTLPMRASADGEAVEYVAGPPATGGDGSEGEGEGNEYLASRASGGGWSAVDLETPGLDKSPFEALLPSELSNNGGSGVPASSSRLIEGSYLLLEGKGELARELSEDAKPELEEKKKLETEAAAYEAIAATTTDPENASRAKTFAQKDRSEAAKIPRRNKLYESTGGRVSLVAVLPDGKAAPDAEFGGGGLSHVISADGSRIFWTDEETGRIYVRENNDLTVAVSMGAAQFWTASTDGRYAFYTEGGALWRFDVESETRENLSGEGAGVLGVIGVNETGEDGAYVYFIADAVLGDGAAHGASAGDCKNGRTCNMYVIHGSVTTFIGTILAEDLYPPPASTVGSDLFGGLGERDVEVASDGDAVVFQSHASLTGYNNVRCTGQDNAVVGCSEVYVYDADTGGLSCVSCNPTGEPPAGEALLPLSYSSTFMHRWISEDGDRVFFQSGEPLVAQDTAGNGVYEWEREGVGSCGVRSPARLNGGCLYLLSGGTSPAFLLDASASGNDVFIISRARLTPQDSGETYEVYDARVGAVEALAPPACTGTGCQGLPSAPPPFATPSSVTFSGIGNFPSGTATGGRAINPVKPKPKTVKCKKGDTKNKGKCVPKKKKKAKAKKSAYTNRKATR